ncbi:hypothetical protein KJ359_002927 [Pestalotiopsis sp. 9143b]|nr:hypothetical protein KJ359_002927 [Pestalotiopsis sp. 9143b]
MKKFVTRLEKFKEQAFHPLVMPMIFAEHERGRFMTAMELKGAKLEARIMDLENRLRADEHRKPRNSEAVKKDNQEMTMKDCDSTKLWDDVSQLRNGTASFIKVLAALEHQLETKTFEKLELRPNVQGKDEAVAQSMSSEYIRCRIKELDAEADGNIRKCESLLAGMALAIQVTFFSMGFFQWIPDNSPQMISPWVAVYLGLTLVITVGMVFFWWRRTKNDSDLNSDLEDLLEYFRIDNMEKGQSDESASSRHSRGSSLSKSIGEKFGMRMVNSAA